MLILSKSLLHHTFCLCQNNYTRNELARLDVVKMQFHFLSITGLSKCVRFLYSVSHAFLCVVLLFVISITPEGLQATMIIMKPALFTLFYPKALWI